MESAWKERRGKPKTNESGQDGVMKINPSK